MTASMLYGLHSAGCLNVPLSGPLQTESPQGPRVVVSPRGNRSARGVQSLRKHGDGPHPLRIWRTAWPAGGRQAGPDPGACPRTGP